MTDQKSARSWAKTKSVPAVERALLILEELAHHGDGVSVAELVRRLALPRSSVHCHLLTLERRGYVHRVHSSGRYMFGLKFFSLANRAVAGLGLRRISRPHLHALMHRTGMTVHMGVLDQNEAVLIEKIDAPVLSRIGTWVGRRLPLHCTALGKALIAYWSDEQVEQLMEQRPTRYNENTIVSASKLKTELERVRMLGYSFDDEEEALRSRCVGAPIMDGAHHVVAAISVAGSTTQIDAERLPLLAQELRATAGLISQQLSEPDEPAVPRMEVRKRGGRR